MRTLTEESFVGLMTDLPTSFLLQLDRMFNRLYARSGNTPYVVREFVDATSAAVTYNLPPLASSQLLDYLVFKTDSSANTITVTADGTDTINGTATYVLNLQYEFVLLAPTLSGWRILARGTLTPSFNSITFPATQVPSTNPNTLDDYEEGTFVPTVTGSGTAGTGTYSVQTGVYTKIGRLVHFSLRVVWSAHTGVGGFRVSLPFTADATYDHVVSVFCGATPTFLGYLTSYVRMNTATARIAEVVSATGTADIALSATGNLNISGTYIT